MVEKQNATSEPPLERALRSEAEVHAQHIQELPRSQLGIEWFTDWIGRPWFAYAIVGFIAAWVGANTLGHGRFDVANFPMLQLIIGAGSLIMAAFILITENRQSAVAEKRAKLTLQLSLANEVRSAKIIELLEQMRRDDPSLPNRKDEEALQMTEAIDLPTALEKMESAEKEAVERAQGN